VGAPAELRPARFAAEHEGRPVRLFLLRNASGMVAAVCNYGARILQLTAPDRSGQLADVVLGYDSFGQLLQGHASMGAFIGRYANRIAHSRFSLNGLEHQLSANQGPHCLHGGQRGSRFRVFDAHQNDRSSLSLNYRFEDGEEGFPGQLDLALQYRLRDDHTLEIRWAASAGSDTVANFTSHAFFNLAGQGQGDVLGHELQIMADAYTPVDESLIPTGAMAPVSGTALDFRQPRPIGERIGDAAELRAQGGAYDHNFVLSKPAGELALDAQLSHSPSGRVMQLWSTEPGLQFYSGQLFGAQAPKDVGKEGARYVRHAGLCLESQHFPDSVHHPHFPSTWLCAGQTLQGRMEYRFSTLT